jgi:hypothetical protein
MHGERVGRIRREEEKRKQEGWEEKKRLMFSSDCGALPTLPGKGDRHTILIEVN